MWPLHLGLFTIFFILHWTTDPSPPFSVLKITKWVQTTTELSYKRCFTKIITLPQREHLAAHYSRCAVQLSSTVDAHYSSPPWGTNVIGVCMYFGHMYAICVFLTINSFTSFCCVTEDQVSDSHNQGCQGAACTPGPPPS